MVYLKYPPPGYLYPGVDLQGSLDKIISDLEKGVYQNEYDVQLDAFNLIVSVHDFHLRWIPDIVSVFTWKRDEYLVSVSSDGLNLPRVYSAVDLDALRNSTSSAYSASPIVEINSMEVETWLNRHAALNPLGS